MYQLKKNEVSYFLHCKLSYLTHKAMQFMLLQKWLIFQVISNVVTFILFAVPQSKHQTENRNQEYKDVQAFN